MSKILRFAQPGYDAADTGDENLIYSSSWPLLKIYKQGSFTVPDVTQRTTILTHGLTYQPLFWYFVNVGVDTPANGAVIADNRSEFMGFNSFNELRASRTELYFPGDTNISGQMKIYYYVFGIDLTRTYQAPIIKVGGVGDKGGNRVFKLAKPGKNINSPNLEDYIFHSKARSPLVHSVNPGVISGGEFTVTHNLGYHAMFFGFAEDDLVPNVYYSIPSVTDDFVIISTNNSITISTGLGFEGKKISVVVLKDPFNVNYSKTVTV